MAATAKQEAARLATEAFQHYLTVREHVRAMASVATADGVMTQREARLLEWVAPLWNASIDDIADLREYSKAITGVRRSHYRGTHAEGLKRQLERDLERLIEKGDADLLVDEPAALAGFGFESFGKTYNEDTLRFFRVISLLQDASLIKDLRRRMPRPTVWEIGGGWGGLAYQVKTLCPDVTYLVTGVPDLFLVSAVYLMAVFPQSRFRFYDPATPDAFWENWDGVDFAFAPECVVAHIRPARVDITFDMMALDGMTRPRIEQHVRRAHELGCPYFFTVCPDGDVDSADATAVEPVVNKWYWSHPVSTAAGLKKRLALGLPRRGAIGRTYRLGWRRLHV